MPMRKAPSKSLIGILLSKKWSSFALPILDSMLLQDLLDSFPLKSNFAGFYDFSIGILGKAADVP